MNRERASHSSHEKKIVPLLVATKVAALCELVSADCALIWLFTRVDKDVPVQSCSLDEGLLTQLTSVALHARVNHCVPSQAPALGK